MKFNSIRFQIKMLKSKSLHIFFSFTFAFASNHFVRKYQSIRLDGALDEKRRAIDFERM